MAIICRQHGLLFLMAPRTGCTAVGTVLLDKLGGEWLPETDLLDEDGKFSVQKKHSTLSQLLDSGVLSRSEREQLTVFTTVRNPFDSLVSLYYKLHSGYQSELDNPNSWVHKVPGYAENLRETRSLSFEQWFNRFYPDLPFYVENPALRRVRNIVKRSLGKPALVEDDFVKGCDYVMRFESLQADFERVLKKSGIKNPPTIPTVNETNARKSKAYQTLYNKKMRRKVEVYKEGLMNEFGYRF